MLGSYPGQLALFIFFAFFSGTFLLYLRLENQISCVLVESSAGGESGAFARGELKFGWNQEEDKKI